MYRGLHNPYAVRRTKDALSLDVTILCGYGSAQRIVRVSEVAECVW